MTYTDNSYKIINDYNFTDSVLGIIKQFEYVFITVAVTKTVVKTFALFIQFYYCPKLPSSTRVFVWKPFCI